MQPKVSMVMPVFNKIDYIDMMLQSVYDQVWDNIELIMVNDGATDGTRERIAEWLPRFKARGYSVIIIDQENQGIPAAVKAGLLRISGDYVCLVDCDDKLEPDYASAMAGWLDGHPEDMWTACLYNRLIIEEGNYIVSTPFGIDCIPSPPLMMEKYLSGKYIPAVWIYMVRSDYFRNCNVTDYFITDLRSTQEPGFILPLIAGCGKLKLIDRPLYNHNYYPTKTAAHKSAHYAVEFQNLYRDMTIKTIGYLKADDYQKQKWCIIANLAHKRFLIQSLKKFADGKHILPKITAEAAELISKYFKPDPVISIEHILHYNYTITNMAIIDCILNTPSKVPYVKGYVIGCGVLGKMGKKIISETIGTSLEPEILWDESAVAGDKINNKTVHIPNYDCLTSDDIIIVYPADNDLRIEILKKIERHQIAGMLFGSDVQKLLPMLRYPQFYDGSIKFAL